MEDTAFKAVLSAELNGDQLAANAEKLITLAQSFDQSGIGGLSEFISNMDDLINQKIQEAEALVDLEDIHTVKIMTIHAAKGLQFPVVFVPYLNSQRRGQRDLLYINPDLGLAVKIRHRGKGTDTFSHCLYNLLKLRQQQKDLAEAKRLFYVAASRASNYLFLSATVEKAVAADSAMSWLDNGFREYGINLLETEKIDLEEFSVSLHHELPEMDSRSTDHEGFFKHLHILQDEIGDLQPADSETEYGMQTLESDIKGRYFSATMIMTYLNNPEEYYARYHLGFFEGDYETFINESANTDFALLLGNLVHRYLERWGLSADDMEFRMDSLFFELDILDPVVQKNLKNELLSIQKSLSKSETADRILNARAGKNETSVTTKLGEDYLTGTLDRMIINDEGLWEVIDYKTNRISGMDVNYVARQYEWQIKTYALLLSRLFPDQGSFPVSLLFVKGDAIYSQTFDNRDIRNLEKHFLNIIREIKKNIPVILP
jgi:ATP-dependent helicase/nuclease subunit A